MQRLLLFALWLPLLHAQTSAVVRAVKGTATLQRASGASSAAVAGTPLDSGDTLSVGSKSWAEIQLDPANHFRAGADTKFALPQAAGGQFRVQLSRGAFDYQVDGYTAARIVVETPSVSIRPLLNGIYRIGV